MNTAMHQFGMTGVEPGLLASLFDMNFASTPGHIIKPPDHGGDDEDGEPIEDPQTPPAEEEQSAQQHTTHGGANH